MNLNSISTQQCCSMPVDSGITAPMTSELSVCVAEASSKLGQSVGIDILDPRKPPVVSRHAAENNAKRGLVDGYTNQGLVTLATSMGRRQAAFMEKMGAAVEYGRSVELGDYCYSSLLIPAYETVFSSIMGPAPMISQVLSLPSKVFRTDRELHKMYVVEVAKNVYHLSAEGVLSFRDFAAACVNTYPEDWFGAGVVERFSRYGYVKSLKISYPRWRARLGTSSMVSSLTQQWPGLPPTTSVSSSWDSVQAIGENVVNSGVGVASRVWCQVPWVTCANESLDGLSSMDLSMQQAAGAGAAVRSLKTKVESSLMLAVEAGASNLDGVVHSILFLALFFVIAWSKFKDVNRIGSVRSNLAEMFWLVVVVWGTTYLVVKAAVVWIAALIWAGFAVAKFASALGVVVSVIALGVVQLILSVCSSLAGASLMVAMAAGVAGCVFW